MKKIVVLTGSFNPVTIAHYNIISNAVAKFSCDEGVFVATNDKYLTKKAYLKVSPPTSFILNEEVRAEMIKSLKKENPRLTYWGTELGGTAPSTYKTLCKLLKDKKKEYPNEDIKLYLLFGADKLRSVSHWDYHDEMISLCEYLVYSRQFDLEKIINNDPFLLEHKDRIHILKVDNEDLEDVSSTKVRNLFFEGKDYKMFMNDGPYQILQRYKPSDFPPLTDEDIIKAHILYDGRFGQNTARLKVFKTNAKLFINWPEWLGDKNDHQAAKVYNKEFKVSVPKLSKDLETDCVNEDCVVVAKTLIDEGFNPAILNLASRISPGGGYHKGTSAQEESLCQTSTLSQSLYQFGDPKYKHIKTSGVKVTPGVYPMDINYGGIYSPCVTFFRENVSKYYALKEKPFDSSVISVASLSNRERNDYTIDERKYFNQDGFLTDEGKNIEANKIRTIYRIALDNGHDSLVLGAFGCGVFNLHSDEVAKLFYDILEEDEFINRFKKIVFAIYEGKASPRKPFVGRLGKFAPFYEIFAGKGEKDD